MRSKSRLVILGDKCRKANIVFQTLWVEGCYVLSFRPCGLKNVMYVHDGSSEELQLYAEVGKQDLKAFLMHRSRELKKGEIQLLTKSVHVTRRLFLIARCNCNCFTITDPKTTLLVDTLFCCMLGLTFCYSSGDRMLRPANSPDSGIVYIYVYTRLHQSARRNTFCTWLSLCYTQKHIWQWSCAVPISAPAGRSQLSQSRSHRKGDMRMSWLVRWREVWL